MGAGSTGVSLSGRLFVVAGVVAALGAATAVAADGELRHHDQRSLHRAEAGVSGAIGTRIVNLDRRAEQFDAVLDHTARQRIETRLAAAPRTDFPSVAVLQRSARGSEQLSPMAHVSTSIPGGTQLLASAAANPRVGSAESIAADSGSPVAVGIGTGPTPSLIVVWPLYDGAPPTTTEARRAGSTGWVIGAAPLQAAIGPALTVFNPIGIKAVVGATDSGPGAVGSVMAQAATVTVTRVPEQSRLPVLFIGIITAVAVALIVLFAFLRRRIDARAAATERTLRRQIQLLSDISVAVQESLDIGLVLPAALTQIAQAHGLSYISVVTGSGHHGRGQLLAIGRRPATVPGPRWPLGAITAAAGQLLRLPLQRASRTLGYVEAISTHSLSEQELASLRSTTDLLANALHNAELYEREQENVRRLRDLDEMKDDFLATVSHELRTPLSVLVGFTSLLARKWDRLTENDRREAVMKSQAHVTSLAHLVNDLLDFVSERRTRNAMPEEIRLQQHVKGVVEQLRPLCERQELQLLLDDEVLAWTDPRAVERIVGNLLSNAAKYSPAGSTITVSTEARGETAVVTVADEGPGISEEEQQRIFERFYRGESDAARSTRGSGIGLSVVTEWLRAVGARLDIASSPGRGTRISVQFPTQPEQKLTDAGNVRWVEGAVAQRSLTR